MAMLPSRVKYRKSHRGSRSGNAQVGTTVAFGEFGLQTLERGWIKNNQIEAVAITREAILLHSHFSFSCLFGFSVATHI